MKKPKIGQVVEVTWVDSGLDISDCKPDNKEVTLVVCKTRGKVVRIGPCPVLKQKVPRNFPSDVIVLEMCSSGPSLGVILWRDVIGVV